MSARVPDAGATVRVKVWDLPTRLFHWALAAVVAGAWLTSLRESWLTAHAWFGEGALVLFAFRVGWGWLGGPFARFAAFVRGPRAVGAFLRSLSAGRRPRHLGHNPPAGWVMLAMLALVGALALTGLAALGGEERVGPAATWIPMPLGAAAHDVHGWLAYALLVAISVHLLGVALHTVLHRENVARAMVTGIRTWHVPLPALPPPRRIAQAVFVAALAAGALAVSTLDPADYRTTATLRAGAPPAPQASEYRSACGECHFPFPPSLLPAGSWRALMAGLDDHFGENATVGSVVAGRLTAYLVAHAAGRSGTEAAYKLLHSVPRGALPLRVTEVPYWRAKHAGLEAAFRRPEVRSRLNCGRCHPDALVGSFEDARIRIPR